VTIFQILSGENWNGVMYDGWRALGSGAVVYFISLIVLGMFIVMTLFLAILLNNFGSDDEEDEGEFGGSGVSDMEAMDLAEVSERNERALMKTSIHTRDESREMATATHTH